MALLADIPRRLWSKARRPLLRCRAGQNVLRWSHRGQPSFQCPICEYRGPFLTHHSEGKKRPHALCPQCGAAERHRLQILVLERIRAAREFQRMSMLHVAPEPCLRPLFRKQFGHYATLDLKGRQADYRADLCNMPFPDQTFDFVFASHVLEHVQEDRRAIAEIARVLRPGGTAVLPVPILGAHTVEYGEPNPHEEGHVRAPGLDYYERLRGPFHRVDLYDSQRFSDEFQVFVHEDRSSWPSTMPNRPTMPGTRHSDYVPVCWR
jgi:SAM-dependent methyltransferase